MPPVAGTVLPVPTAKARGGAGETLTAGVANRSLTQVVVANAATLTLCLQAMQVGLPQLVPITVLSTSFAPILQLSAKSWQRERHRTANSREPSLLMQTSQHLLFISLIIQLRYMLQTSLCTLTLACCNHCSNAH